MASKEVYLDQAKQADFTAIEPDRAFSRGHDEYIQPPDILFGDQRKDIECVIKPFDKEEFEAEVVDHKETERADARYVTIDENPVNDRITKTIELSEAPVLSESTSSNTKKASGSHRRKRLPKQKVENKKFPGEIKEEPKKRTLKRYTNNMEINLSNGQKEQTTSGTTLLKENTQPQPPQQQPQPATNMRRQEATSRPPPSLTPPPPGPSRYQLEREKQLRIEQQLAHQVRLNSANMEVENHAQRKQLKNLFIQALGQTLTFSEEDSPTLRNHKEHCRNMLLSQQVTSMLTELFHPHPEGARQDRNRQQSQDMFGQVIQH